MTSTRRPSPLRARRLLRGLRLRDLEQFTGIADTTLSRLERGELPLVGRWLDRLSDFYKTPTEALRREMARYLGDRSDQDALGGKGTKIR